MVLLSRNPSPNTRTLDPGGEWRSHRGTQTETRTPHNNRKPSVYTPGTEAARAMQVTRPNEIRSPGVRLHPKASTALGLKAERATPKHLGTQYQEHACIPWERDTPGSPVNPYCSAQRRGRAQPRGHTLPARQVRHAGCDQPSRRCPGLLILGATSQV